MKDDDEPVGHTELPPTPLLYLSDSGRCERPKADKIGNLLLFQICPFFVVPVEVPVRPTGENLRAYSKGKRL